MGYPICSTTDIWWPIWASDLGPPATDISWPTGHQTWDPLEQHLVVATEVRTVCKRAVCFLLANMCAVGETDNQIVAFFS